MNTHELIDMLALHVEDPEKRNFTNPFKVTALNNGVMKVVQELRTDYLTELQYIKTGVTVTAGATAALTSSLLDYNVLRGGDGVIAVKDAGTGTWMHRITFQSLGKLKNQYLAGTKDNPLYYVFDNKIYVQPTTITSIDVYFLRQPSTLLHKFTASGGSQTTVTSTNTDLSETEDIYNDTVIYNITTDAYFVVNDYAFSSPTATFTVDDPGGGTAAAAGNECVLLTHDFDSLTIPGIACDLNLSIQELAVMFAEAECWQMDRQIDRWKTAFEAVNARIKVLNDRYEAVQGIGTLGEKRTQLGG